ncbi:sensor domain-containing phosphodiesterase [Arthrobacter bambusae]|uniref:sensor domain-containing phosphodiesterase n=1 Tax=Arthrobacter bambusae TaxID=1338426 RepID=UPI002782C59E|nr:EAL domain-containing protein [Arthrobacter bambusae]MDQ0212640.1 PAS domain S-box-containing protein [Arthrobacter bambusae]MDQ0237083.1 PAS domain S-box-containing protein [Arthrobacter bambusae]
MIRSFLGGRLLVVIVCVQLAFAAGIAAALGSGLLTMVSSVSGVILISFAGSLIVLAFLVAVKGIRAHHTERSRARNAYDLIETVAHTSQEWLWEVDQDGVFLFSSRASKALLGYEPSELIGRPCRMVIDLDELASARQSVAATMDPSGARWNGVVVICRHRNGAPVWMEVDGRARPSGTGFAGTSRAVPAHSARALLKERITDRVEATLRGRVILTAFQPIYELAGGTIIGVEALARFPSEDGKGPEHWFNEASTVGLGGELEFAALESALEAAGRLPSRLYVALNLSPETCLDPRLPGFLEKSALADDRIVLELTENLAVDEYAPLMAALAPLRRRGLRIAVDDAGSGFASMRHILQLRPDIVKLDRTLIAGIDNDQAQQALGKAMVEFARQIGATIVAEGIETRDELASVTRLGMNAGQGYFLGRPTIRPAEWETWGNLPRSGSDETADAR